MRHTLYVFFLLLYLPGISQSNWSVQDHNFVVQVKQISEFMERFNGDTSSLIYQYKLQNFPELPMEREEFILTLFDRQKSDWDTSMVRNFIREVKQRPEELDFYDDNWFARLDCSVTYNDKPQHLVLTLQVEYNEAYESKWVIRGVDADFLSLDIAKSDHNFLNPASEGTDFMNIRNLFKAKKENIKGFLYENFKPGKMALFIQELLEGNISFNQIDQITYHFLQIEGWGFQVNKISRDSPNSGWLISHLNTLSEKDKSTYRREILHID